jgi:hypothetical protein
MLTFRFARSWTNLLQKSATLFFCLLMTGICSSSVQAEDSLLINLQSLTEYRIQYLENPFLRDASQLRREIPGWSVPYKHKGFFFVDKATDFLGNTSRPGFEGERKSLWQTFSRIPCGDVKIVVWCRGSGSVGTRIMLSADAPDLDRKKEPEWQRFPTSFGQVTEDWGKLEWVLKIPSEVQCDGKAIKAQIASFQVFMNGKIILGAIAVVPVDYESALADVRQQSAELKPPLLTVPCMKNTPVIDGKLDVAEWTNAAAVTGFVCISSGHAVSPRQTMLYTGYGKGRLFIAWDSTQQGTIVKGSSSPRTAPEENRPDAVEFWIDCDSQKRVVQFRGMSAGGYQDFANGDTGNALPAWEYKCSVEHVSRMVNGIETFDTHRWIAELSVPLKDLGLPPDPVGKSVRMNFCRVFSPAPGKAHTPDNNITWAPLKGGFNDSDHFGTLRFSEAHPFVRILRNEMLPDNQWHLLLTAATEDNPLRVVSAITAGTREIYRSEKRVSPGNEIEIDLSDKFSFNEPITLNGLVEVREENSGQVVYSQEGRFTTKSPLDVELVPILCKDELKVGIRLGNLKTSCQDLTVALELLNAAGETLAGETMKVRAHVDDLNIATFKTKGFAPGNYLVRIAVTEAEGAITVITSERNVTLPEKPVWLNNSLGMSDAVPAPWHPLKIEGNTVDILLREYALGTCGLPAQVTATGERLFVDAPRIEAIVNGVETPCEFEPLSLRENSDAKAVWEIAGHVGSLSIRGSVAAEFDGFVSWDVTFCSDKPVILNRLALVFPFYRERALIARGRDDTTFQGRYAAALFTGKSASSAFIVGNNHHYSDGAWAWPEKWLSDLWIGDDVRGFGLMCESDRNHFGKTRTTIVDNDVSRNVTVHLVSTPHEFQGDLSYSYMWQATPVKPFPENPKARHSSRDVDEPGFLPRGYFAYRYGAFEKVGVPVLRKYFWDDKNLAIKDAGIKILPYYSTYMLDVSNEETKPFLPYWQQRPFTEICFRSGPAVLCSHGTSYDDYICHVLDTCLNRLGLGGIYLDVSGVMAYTNPYAKIGDYDAQTRRWKPVVDIRAARALYNDLCKAQHKSFYAEPDIM